MLLVAKIVVALCSALAIITLEYAFVREFILVSTVTNMYILLLQFCFETFCRLVQELHNATETVTAT